jgi:DNA-binding NarL/FixJ family response regulator
MRILVIEDHADILANVSEYFVLKGCEVTGALDGVTGLHLAMTGNYDAIILDVMLPGMDGNQVCHKLRSVSRRHTPILILTARDELEDRLTGFRVGADDYIVKPFDGDELIARVRRLLVRTTGTGRLVEARTRNSAAVASLTGRERQVLVLLARGRNQSQIAGELFISSKTVATHIQRTLAKLGLHSRAEAVALAHRERLADADAHVFAPTRSA